MSEKIACIFPGIGYTCDKPLLHYSEKLLKGMGWEVRKVSYGGFPKGLKENAEKRKKAGRMAMEQAEECLRDVDWKACGEILFVGKSVGSAVCGAYAMKHGLSCRHILFTPVLETFRADFQEAIAFHGTADPWAETAAVEKECEKAGIRLYETPNANHSLETGDVDLDIRELRKVMNAVRRFAMPWIFRDIREEDSAEAAEIETICFPPNEVCLPEHLIQRIRTAPEFFLAAQDRASGRLAGFLNGIASNETRFRDAFFTDASLHDPEGENIMLLGLDVRPEYRRQGLARELMSVYAELHKGKRQVLTCHEQLADMYRKFGFRDLGISDSVWGGVSWHEMERV